MFEAKDGWARISKFYDGAVEGQSGKVARWVSAKYLVKNLPAEEATSSPVEEAINPTTQLIN